MDLHSLVSKNQIGASLSYFIDNMHAAFSVPASGDLQLTDAFLAYLRYIGPVGAAFAESVMKQAQPIMEAAMKYLHNC